MPKCSLKIFNADLKDLEKEGVIKREVFAEVPLMVYPSISTIKSTTFAKPLMNWRLVVSSK